MVMAAAWIDHGTLWIGTEGTATHDVRAHDRGLQGLEGKRGDAGFRCGPARVAGGRRMQWHYGLRACRELHLRHAGERAARPLPEELIKPIVEHGRSIALEAHRATRTARVESVPHQRDQDVHVSELAHPVRVCDAMPRQRCRDENRM